MRDSKYKIRKPTKGKNNCEKFTLNFVVKEEILPQRRVTNKTLSVGNVEANYKFSEADLLTQYLYAYLSSHVFGDMLLKVYLITV